MVFQGDLYFKYIYLEKNRVNYLKNAVVCATKQQFFFPVIRGVLHSILDLPGE